MEWYLLHRLSVCAPVGCRHHTSYHIRWQRWWWWGGWVSSISEVIVLTDLFQDIEVVESEAVSIVQHWLNKVSRVPL